MISLEQVRQLDIRVKKAVTAVKGLSAENADLKRRIAELEARLDELTREASDRQADEQRLEVSLQGVLDVLDEVDGETAGAVPDEEDAAEGFPADGDAEEPENQASEDEDENGGDPIDVSLGMEAETEDQDEAPADQSDESKTPEADGPVPIDLEEDESEPSDRIDVPESDAEPAFDDAETPPVEEKADLGADSAEEVELDGESEGEDDEDRFQSEFDIF